MQYVIFSVSDTNTRPLKFCLDTLHDAVFVVIESGESGAQRYYQADEFLRAADLLRQDVERISAEQDAR